MHIELLELALNINDSPASMASIAKPLDDKNIPLCISNPWDCRCLPVICIEAAPLYPFPVGRCHLHDKGENFDDLYAHFIFCK